MLAKIILLAVTVNSCYCGDRVVYRYKPLYTGQASHVKYMIKSPTHQVYSHREPAPTHEEVEDVLNSHEVDSTKNLNYFLPQEANSAESFAFQQPYPVSYKQYYQGNEPAYHKEETKKYHVTHIPEYQSEIENEVKYQNTPTSNYIKLQQDHAKKYVPHYQVQNDKESEIKYHHVAANHHSELEDSTDKHESHDEPVDYYAYPKYEYEYKIEDPHTGDNKFHHEHRDGDSVKGVYSLIEADGSIRTVEYTSDKLHGFNAVVKHTAPSQHVQIESHHDA